MVAFDNNIFCISIHPDAKGATEAKDRVEFLLLTLKDQNERIILPTPALAEFLIFAGDDAPLYLEKLRENSTFRIEPFDERAAIELAHVEITARRRGNKRGPADESAWQKVKFDRQIVAIAKANGATCIYSTDPDVIKHAADFGISAKTIADLPKPPAVQESLAFGGNQQAPYDDPYRFRRAPDILSVRKDEPASTKPPDENKAE